MKRFEVGRNMECLCGSGRKYKNCCLEYSSKDINISNVHHEIELGNFLVAYNYCKAELTKYMRNIRSRTEVLLVNNPMLGNLLLGMDIRSLSELVDTLMFIVARGDIDVDVIGHLDRLGNIFYNQKWHKRLVYCKAAWYYLYKDNQKYSSQELSKIPYRDIEDLDHLQLYLDVKNSELSFSQKIEIIDKLIGMEKKHSVKIQYMGAKAIEYFLVGDDEKAKEILKDAINVVKGNYGEFIDAYDYFQVGNIYYHSGTWLEREEYFEESIVNFNKVIGTGDMTQLGYAMVYCHIGDVYATLKNNESALEYYKKSLEHADYPLSKIFSAGVYIGMEEYDSAKRYLEEVNIEGLTEDNLFDYLLVYAKLIISTKNKAEVGSIISKLKEFPFDSSYFKMAASDLIIELQQIMLEESPSNTKQQSITEKLISKINRYLLLEPNISGIGINLNNILEDFTKRKR